MDRRRRVLFWAALLAAMFVLALGGLVAALVRHGGGDRWTWLLWGVVQLGGLAWAVHGIERVTAQPFTPTAKVLGLFLVFPFLWLDCGRVYPCLATFSLVVALVGLGTTREGRPALGGGLLGLGAVLQPALILLFPWFLRRRRLRAAAGFAAVFILLFAAAWLLQARPSLGVMDSSPGILSLFPGRGEELPRSASTSLLGLLERLLPQATASRWVLYGSGGVVLLAAAILLARHKKPGASLAWSAGEVATALALSLALVPFSTAADHVALFPAAVLGFDAFRLSSNRRWRRVGAVLWSGALLASATAWIAPLSGEPPGERLAFGPLIAVVLLSILALAPPFYPARRRAPAGACV